MTRIVREYSEADHLVLKHLSLSGAEPGLSTACIWVFPKKDLVFETLSLYYLISTVKLKVYSEIQKNYREIKDKRVVVMIKRAKAAFNSKA